MKRLLILLLVCYTLIAKGQIDPKIYPKPEKTVFKELNELKGNITQIDTFSYSLKEPRSFDIFLPKEYHSDSIYDLVLVTDNEALNLALMLEDSMNNKKINPFIIVSIHNRNKQPIDSIFGDFIFDSRSAEMIDWANFYKLDENGYPSESTDTTGMKNVDSVMLEIVSNRRQNYNSWIIDEVIAYMESNFKLTKKDNWTIGGYSNGAAYAVHLSSLYPNMFKNIIIMSYGGSRNEVDLPSNQFGLNYFLCAGIEESFHTSTLSLAKKLQIQKTNFIHKTYQTSHDHNMWDLFYRESLTKIYLSK